MNRMGTIEPGRYSGARALVLGASGFIGRWVTKGLEDLRATVLPVVRDARSTAGMFRDYGIESEPIELDLIDTARVEKTLSDLKPSIVFNLAGYGIDRSERNEQTAELINDRLIGTILQSIADTPSWSGRRLVHVGSALEYGTAGGNLDESTRPEPTTLYGRTKLAGTERLMKICRDTGIPALTARLFTIYGPGEHPGRLLPALIETSRTGRPLELTDGRQLRDFTYVEDAAEGLLRLGLSAGSPGEVVNLATGRLTPVLEFIETAAQVLGIPRNILLTGALPTRHEEMSHDAPTLELLEKLIDWVPHTNIYDGICRTMKFSTLHDFAQ